MKKLKRNAKGQSVKLRRCYVYEIRVDGVVRYIGKGCDDRIYSHLIESKADGQQTWRQNSKSGSAFSENVSLCRSARLKDHRKDNPLQPYRC